MYSSHADSKDLELQQKVNFAMGIYTPDRMYLCTSLLKGKSASLSKHKSQSQNTLQNMSLCTELTLKIGKKKF